MKTIIMTHKDLSITEDEIVTRIKETQTRQTYTANQIQDAQNMHKRLLTNSVLYKNGNVKIVISAGDMNLILYLLKQYVEEDK